MEPGDQRGTVSRGTPFIWLSSMGLVIGLGMIIGLLLVIIWEGLCVFWPPRLVQLELTPDSPSAKHAGTTVLAGEVRMKKRKLQRELSADNAESRWEWQLFVGNRRANGHSFIFIDRDDIAASTRPENLMRIERQEFGDAIGTPVALEVNGGARIGAGDAAFARQLRRVVDEASQRRRQIEDLEKNKIGRINGRMEQQRLRQKADGLVPSFELPPETPLQQEILDLQRAYEKLAAQSTQLRQLQRQDRLIYTLPDGREQELAAGDIFSYYYPNRLSLPQRCGLMCKDVCRFIIESPREANTEGGIFPAIFGTFAMTIIMSLLVTPFGVLSAVYLHEYARQGFMVRLVRIAINNLAGVPSIVFGVFGLGFFVYFVGGTLDHLFFSLRLPTPTFGTGGILWASLTLALLTVPVVIVATEESLSAVPRGVREGSLACGASKWQTIQRVVMPAAAPGIMTGMILAMARGAGEVAPLMLVGVVKIAPSLIFNSTAPFVHLDQKFMHLGFHIYDLGFQSPDSEAAKPMVFATTLLLIVLVVILNLTGIIVRDRLRKRLAPATF